MHVVEKLKALREKMSEYGMDAYYIGTSDFHDSEYVGPYFKARAYMSGFSGSQGTLIVLKDQAALWVDGRYFIQAENQLKDSTIDLMKMGQEGTPSISEYLNNNLNKTATIGMDGRCISASLMAQFQKDSPEMKFIVDKDVVGEIWKDRPVLESKKGFLLDVKYTGYSTQDKLDKIRKILDEKQADCHILNGLDDIAYILNLRGDDIPHFPVLLSYLMIFHDHCIYYVDQNKLNDEMKQHLQNHQIMIKCYDDIYEDVKHLTCKKVLLDKNRMNYRIVSSLPSTIDIIDEVNPTQMMKAIRHDVELECTRHAHILDGVAMCKFMYWLKKNIGKIEMDECSVADYLESCRRAIGAFDISFDTIAAYGSNAAMMHYCANKETCATLKPEGMLLVDSGGHYLQGTTDITRTFVLGKISDKMKLHFTTALRSHIRLATAKFLYGCRGVNLDMLTRGPIWDLDLDYQCGTGHGVGHVLNVHEGPNGIRWKIVPERNDSCILEANMLLTNEPGIYLENEYGIRHENEMIIHNGNKNAYGQFMYFETITFVPIDLDGIDPSLLTQYEKEWLNHYHKEVFEKISPYLNDDEVIWLKEATREI